MIWSLRTKIYRIKYNLLRLKYAWQRAYRGYDDIAYCSLYSYIADIAYPVLVKMAEKGSSYPYGLSPEEWQHLLKKMAKGIYWLQDTADILSLQGEAREAAIKDKEEGKRLFCEWLEDLWV